MTVSSNLSEERQNRWEHLFNVAPLLCYPLWWATTRVCAGTRRTGIKKLSHIWGWWHFLQTAHVREAFLFFFLTLESSSESYSFDYQAAYLLPPDHSCLRSQVLWLPALWKVLDSASHLPPSAFKVVGEMGSACAHARACVQRVSSLLLSRCITVCFHTAL
jgi:hypothetical protein